MKSDKQKNVEKLLADRRFRGMVRMQLFPKKGEWRIRT